MLSEVDAICLNAWELISIHSQAPPMANEDGKSADALHKHELTRPGVKSEKTGVDGCP